MRRFSIHTAVLGFGLFLISLPALGAETADVSGKLTVNGHPTGDYGIVYLIPDDPDAPPPKPVTATIDQRGFAFHPDVLIVTAGSTLRFENHDNEIHNAKSYSQPNKFDIGAQFPNTVKETVVKKPGIVVLRCKVHHQMRGTVMVLPTQWFDRTDADGTFDIRNVPPGSYRFETWLSGMDDREMEQNSVRVRLKAGDKRREVLNIKTTHAVGPLVSPEKGRNWESVVSEIHTELRGGLSTWERGQVDKAEDIVMAAYYEKFGRTGLRSLISQELGEHRGRQLEGQFLEIAKLMKTPGGVTGQELQNRIDGLNRQLSIDLSRFSLDFSFP